MILTNIYVLKDNYIWILYNKNNSCIIIDPGLSDVVIKKIIEKKWKPEAILLTHNHRDHTDGIKKILQKYPDIIIYGPKETKKHSVHKIVKGGDKIYLLDKKIYVISTPGHTLNHVSYYLNPYLFCGDTIFSAGCGRVFQNNYSNMYYSIQLIKSFPEDTILCCGHEYTLSNLIFSMHILPEDQYLKYYFQEVKEKIFLKKKIPPFFLKKERKVNIFLRTDDIYLRRIIDFNKCSFEIFCYLRKLKDNFGAKRD
ncbi:hydroxyacylglutathione hydrolase [Buchnera aphidicola]|uniref:Hydroxyacylglutathione hydrolase n=1 Tax=Buchnera aphidicola (Aphis nerii) TaxID=1241835 RepID=A0A4D6XW16_9GAMM|nr:hydroxyacylglutathione hydrolase [Buchnera aphidicola]QCI18794.1 hydroxyacylglutathione hydrolase [Buchnera aphidicola (Aphis nerii)]